MSVSEPTAVPVEMDSDTQAIIDHVMTGKPLDADVARRVREQGERIRLQILAKHGLVDIAVPAIRELRGELPNPYQNGIIAAERLCDS